MLSGHESSTLKKVNKVKEEVLKCCRTIKEEKEVLLEVSPASLSLVLYKEILISEVSIKNHAKMKQRYFVFWQ